MPNIFHIDRALAAGVITDALPVASILSNVLQFLLSVIGILAIIGLVISGTLYFSAAGDRERVTLAKRAALASVVGLIIALGALILVSQLTTFFSESLPVWHISSLQTPVLDTVL